MTMGLSKEQWRNVAEASAAAKYGERYASWLAFRRFGATPLLIAAAIGTVGLGAWWVWSHLIDPLLSGVAVGGPGIPLLYWIAVALAGIGTAAALRIPVIHFGVFLARAAAVGIVWLVLIGYGVSLL